MGIAAGIVNNTLIVFTPFLFNIPYMRKQKIWITFKNLTLKSLQICICFGEILYKMDGDKLYEKQKSVIFHAFLIKTDLLKI